MTKATGFWRVGPIRYRTQDELYEPIGKPDYIVKVPGVHTLSEEGAAALERAHLRGQMIADRHIKRGR